METYNYKNDGCGLCLNPKIAGQKPVLRRLLAVLILAFISTVTIGQPYPTFSISESGGTINVSDYGAYPDDGIDDEDSIQAAINAAGPNTVVVFEAGTYNFRAPDDPSRSSTLTGAQAHIQVSGKTNITLRGAVDATTGEPTTIFDRDLLFYTNQPISGSYDRVSILDARDNNGVKIENVAFKSKLHYTVGKVLSINSTTITVEILDGYPMDDGCLVASANVWTWDEVTEGEEILKIGEPSVTYGDNDGHSFTITDSVAKKMECVKTGNAFYGKAAVGDYISWHYGWNGRGTVYLTRNTNTHLENVHIYTALRSALFISYSHNLYMNELEIRPENDRFSMSPRDGVHASRNTGEFVGENMYIKGTRLDGYVITGTAADVHSITDSRNIEIITDQSVGTFNYQTSGPLYFYDNNERHEIGVQSASYVSHSSAGTIYDVNTSEDIPSFVAVGTDLIPAGLSPDTVIVRNSTFKSIGGASELYFCDNVFSSNNYHENIMYSPVRLGANITRNHTGGNLTFSGNEYVDCAWEGNYYKSNQYGYISAFNLSSAYSGMYMSNLLIENNEFTSTTSATSLPPIELDEVGDVLIRNNIYNGFSQKVKLWDVFNVTNEDAAIYRLKNMAFGNFLRGYDPTDANTSGNDANVTHEGLNTTTPDQQLWEFSEVSTQQDHFYIKNLYSDKSLRAHDANNTPTSGNEVPVTVYTTTAWGSMMWKKIPVPGDTNTYYLKSYSGNYFLKGASTNTSYATMESDSTTEGTKWVLYDTSGPLPDTTTATSAILHPAADAYVKGGTDANNNFGSANTLVVKESSNASYDRMSFLMFDLSAISGDVATATIRIKVKTDDTGASHSLHAVTDDSWTESGITWNNKPAVSSLISTETVPAIDGWIEFDVASLVNSQTNDTLSVRLSDANASEHYVLYHSMEATDSTEWPQLQYTLAEVPDPIIPIEDAFVKGGTAADTNYGSNAELQVKESSNANYDRMSFLKFDLSAISSSVSSAKIRLKVETEDAGSSHQLHSVSDDNWTEAAITWNNKPSTTSLISTVSVPSLGNWIEFDVTTLVNNETDDTLSVRISDANAAEDYVIYHSSEATNDADRPQLVYTIDSSSRLVAGESVLKENEALIENSFTVYPNPASDQITIKGLDLNGTWVEISDLSGKRVLKTTIQEDVTNSLNVDLSSIEKGVYILRIATRQSSSIQKIIIE